MLSVLSTFSLAHAQNCYSSTVAYDNPCAEAANSFKSARANCKSGLLVTAGSSAGACQTPNALVENIAAQCSSQCVAPPPPPQTAWYSSFSSTVSSYEASAENPNLVKVTWKHTGKDRMTCGPAVYTYIAVLDKSKAKEAAYFLAYPGPDATKYISIKLSCPTSLVSTTSYSSTDYDRINPIITYNSNCVLDSYSAGSAPSAMCMIP
jgi:hypothetical protein